MLCIVTNIEQLPLLNGIFVECCLNYTGLRSRYSFTFMYVEHFLFLVVSSNGHLMTHREKKPYQCQVENCEKSYCDARSLRRHLEANHQQSPEEITNSVLASMTAAGIATTIHNGKPRALDKLFIQQEAARMQQMASPTFW